jgi:peptidoglycan hydrolase-like protein with peptidoglycan-binding domain
MPTRAYDPYIRDSVGTGGTNNAADVLAVQQLLNDVSSNEGGPAPQLAEDGIIGPNTINAIKHFQMTHFGFEDGRVDPGKKTLIKLVEFRPE